MLFCLYIVNGWSFITVLRSHLHGRFDRAAEDDGEKGPFITRATTEINFADDIAVSTLHPIKNG